MNPPFASRRVCVVAFLVLLFAIAGCAGQSAPTIPTIATTPSAGGSSTTTASQTIVSSDPVVVWPQFAACLRAHGVNVADPGIDAQGEPLWKDPAPLQSLSPAVHTACDPIAANIPGAVPPAQGKGGADHVAGLLQFSQCMRDHGVPNYPDPDANGNVILPDSISKRGPAMVAAIEACQSVLTTNSSPVPSK